MKKLICFLTNANVQKFFTATVIASCVLFCAFGIAALQFQRPDLEQIGMYIGIPAGVFFALALIFLGPIILDQVEHETNVTTPMWFIKGMAAFISIMVCAFLFGQVVDVLDLPRGTWTLLAVVPMTFIYNVIMKELLKKPIGFVRKYSCS